MEESKAILVTKIAIENKRLSHSDVHSVRASTISQSLHHACGQLGSELFLTKEYGKDDEVSLPRLHC